MNPGGLTTGTYATFLTATAGSSTVNLPIVLNVNTGTGAMNSPVSANPSSLVFNVQPGSATTQTQQISVSTTSSSLGGVTVAPILSSTGNWLTVNPTTTTISSGTPANINVTVNPSVLANPGVYNAVVAINPPGTTGTAVPVVVNVAAPQTVNIAPSQLNFFYQTGTSVSPTQTLNITSPGGTAVAFSAAASTTSCGNSWLVVTPSNSATPGNLTVQINPSGLQVGQCAGTITITSPGSATPTQTVPVNLTVTNSPLIQVPSTGPTFTYQLGSGTQVPAQNIQVSSSGTSVPFTVAATPVNGGASFLTVTPGSGTTSSTSPASVALGIDTTVLASLAPGTYTENVTVTSAGAGNSPQTFPVTLVVSNNPILTTTQPSVTFNYQIGKSSPPSQVVQLNSTGAPLNFTASASSGGACGNFFSVTPTSGMTMGVPPQTGQLIVTANVAGIQAATTCTGTITLNVPNSTNAPVTIPVTLNASTTPLINPSRGSITVTALAGSNTLSQQIVALTSTDFTTALNFTATASTSPIGLTWLSVAPNTGTTPSNLNVIVNAANLPPGTYTGSINISSTSANVPSQSISVTLNVVSAVITPSVQTLSFTQPVNGQSPAAQTVTIANLPAGTTTSATATTLNGSGNWLTATAGANGTITVSANGTGLTQGVYQGVVTVIAPGATPSPLYIPVTFTVGSPQTLSFSAPSVNFTTQAGATTLPGSQQIQITSSGGNVPFNVAFTPVTGGNFVTVTPATGNTPGPVTVSLAQGPFSSLGPGTYTGIITVSSPSIPNGAQTIPVNLVVGQQGPPQVSSVVNAASNQPGAISPGEIVTIYGSGLGPDTPLFLTLTGTGTVSTTAGDVTVTFDGIAAPLIYVSASQINAIVPYEIAGRATTTMVIKRNSGSSSAIQLAVANTSPAIFSLNQTGSGPGAIINRDNTVNGPSHPAPKGTVIAIYATGAGSMNPAQKTGDVTGTTAPFPIPVGNVKVTIGGLPADITYAGAAPGLVAGALQVNARIPNGVPSGPQPVVLTVGDASSLPNITVDVQ